MEELFGKLKQAVGPSRQDGPAKATATPPDPSVARIDLKTASRDEVVTFVKRQNKHIQQLESLLDQLEKRHKEYKVQLREYAEQIQALRTLEHVQGDEALKQRIQALLVERDALAAELHLLQEEREKHLTERQNYKEMEKETSNHQSHSSSADQASEASSPDETQRNVKKQPLQSESMAQVESETNTALKTQIEAATASNQVKQANLTRIIDTQQQEITTLQAQVQQMTAACEALKSRLSHSSTQHASQLQQFSSTHESKLQTLNATILQLQHELTNLKQRQEDASKEAAIATPSQVMSSDSEASISLVQERDSLKEQVEALQRQVETLKSESKSMAATGPTASSITSSIVDPLTSHQQDSNSLQLEAQARELEAQKEKVRALEEKLQSKQSLLVKAHKHLGELTAQLADANLRAEAVIGERLRVESLTASLSELRARNGQLEASLEESLQEFKEYKAKVSLQEETAHASPGPSESPSMSSDIPIVLQEKLAELQRSAAQLQAANAEHRSANEILSREIFEIRSQHDAASAQLRHLKEKDVSRAVLVEKHQAELKKQEDAFNERIVALKTQLDSSSSSTSSQLNKLKSKADEAIQQKDAEIAMLKDTVEVLKVQLAQTESKRSSVATRVTETSEPTTRRRVASDQAFATAKNRVGERSPSPSSRLQSIASPSSAIDAKMAGEQEAQIQTLLGRLKSLQDQVSELEQLLALSREQEQFLKLELRRNDRSTPISSSASTSSPSPSTPSRFSSASDFSSPNDFFLLRNVIKTMLERREIPNVAVFADLLKFTPEEMDMIQSRSKEASSVANAVGSGINALWNVFGSPQR